MEFRTGVSGREMNDPEREKERERERTKRNGESVFKKNGRVSQWKTGAAGVSNKIRADARSRVIDIENVSPRANSLASIRPITFSPTPLFWHLFVIAASRDRISTRRDTRLLLDGISNCNDSSPTVCSSYCFPISGPRRNCADTTEGGKGRSAERNTPPTVEEEKHRASSLSWLLSSPEYSLARVLWYDSYAKETFALKKKSGYRHYIGRNICQQFVRQCKFVKWWNVTFVKVLTKRKKKNGWPMDRLLSRRGTSNSKHLWRIGEIGHNIFEYLFVRRCKFDRIRMMKRTLVFLQIWQSKFSLRVSSKKNLSNCFPFNHF